MSIVSIDDIVKKLIGIGKKTIGEARAISDQALEITSEFNTGSLSQNDYQELMNDLAQEKLELITADEMVIKEELYSLFNDIKHAVSFIP